MKGPATPLLADRKWIPDQSRSFFARVALETAAMDTSALADRIQDLAARNRDHFEDRFVNLDPASMGMSPRAEALLSGGLGTRPSLGYPGAKHESGLECIEEIEVMTAALAAQCFSASFAEVRVPSGVIANLVVFMALARPGDAIIALPSEAGGHVSHLSSGAAGLFGLSVHPAPFDPQTLRVDPDLLRRLANSIRPRLISIGPSLTLFPQPLAELRVVAEAIGATLLFDAAHVAGLIAGGVWPQPLEAGAHVLTMSTYKSLGGPPGGLILTRDPAIAKPIERVVFPGLTANFDVGRVAALAMTLAERQSDGAKLATAMVDTAAALAARLAARDLTVLAAAHGFTKSHQIALDLRKVGGGRSASRRLRQADLIATPAAIPAGPDAGLRLGTPELVRRGAGPADMAELADLIAQVLATSDPELIAARTAEFRRGLS